MAQEYKCGNGDQSIKLTVKLGTNGIAGIPSVMLEQGGQRKMLDIRSNNQEIDLGPADSLIGAKIICTSAIVNGDAIFADYNLKGGKDGPKVYSIDSRTTRSRGSNTASVLIIDLK